MFVSGAVVASISSECRRHFAEKLIIEVAKELKELNDDNEEECGAEHEFTDVGIVMKIDTIE